MGPHWSRQLAEIKFDTQEQVAAFLKECREHLVIEVRRKKYVLVATFKSIEEARDYMQRIKEVRDSNKSIEKVRKPTEKTKYLIWVCLEL